LKFYEFFDFFSHDIKSSYCGFGGNYRFLPPTNMCFTHTFSLYMIFKEMQALGLLLFTFFIE
jgi:hypothetical protein